MTDIEATFISFLEEDRECRWELGFGFDDEQTSDEICETSTVLRGTEECEVKTLRRGVCVADPDEELQNQLIRSIIIIHHTQSVVENSKLTAIPAQFEPPSSE